jgi:ABC-type lipoprotein release transport system permease subunit
VGLLSAWWGARVLQSVLFGVEPRDPAVFTAVAVLVSVVALVASWIPARRAMGTDPAVVLKGD